MSIFRRSRFVSLADFRLNPTSRGLGCRDGACCLLAHRPAKLKLIEITDLAGRVAIADLGSSRSEQTSGSDRCTREFQRFQDLNVT